MAGVHYVLECIVAFQGIKVCLSGFASIVPVESNVNVAATKDGFGPFPVLGSLRQAVWRFPVVCTEPSLQSH